MSIQNIVPGLGADTSNELNKRGAWLPTYVVGTGINLTLANNSNIRTVMVSTAHAHTITLMPSPRDGDVVIVMDATGTASANNITISGNGNNIRAATPLVVSTDYAITRLTYSATADRWLY